ncbi:MAG: hypothetical protein JWM68_3281 [Verrucomicrobiales bacterium]|nr:hypothetical protein [Verrucomicrobiales bacterium]
MKNTKLVVVALALVVVGIYFWQRPVQKNLPGNKIETPEASIEREDAVSGKSWKRAATQTQAEPASARIPVAVVHQATDFIKGESANTVVTDGLQMGGEARFKPRLFPYKLFGIYISPEEQSADVFDTVIPSCKSTTVEGTKLTFELRTKSREGDWSVWQEVSTNQLEKPFLVNSPALNWQYRLTFYADDPAQSPKVSSVSILTSTATTIASSNDSSVQLPAGHN